MGMAQERMNDFNQKKMDYSHVSRLVYNSTTLDRLYPILQSGLKVQANSQDIRVGAAHGTRIYTTTDLDRAFSYSRPSNRLP